jgi:lipoprotein-anchoring transpeptidase ErfK/SrfK
VSAAGSSGLRVGQILRLLVAAIPAVPIIAGFLITAGATSRSGSKVAGYRPAARVATAGTPDAGATIAVLERPTIIRSMPAGRPLATLRTRTEFGSPAALWVVNRSAGWLGVVSPAAGNGNVGWIPESAASLTRVPWQLRVSLSQHRLTVLLDGRGVESYVVAVGRGSAPTPTGRFSVTDRLLTSDPAGPYGCCILALSAHSPHAIQGWSGGDRIAIHSTPDTASIGRPVTHGCLRLTLAEGRWLINHIPLGTPTLIGT